MRFKRLLIIVNLLMTLSLGGLGPALAQVSKPTTLSEAERTILERLTRPRRTEIFVKQNRTYEGQRPLGKTLESLVISEHRLDGVKVKALVKRGGVDSGGGDALGLEFLEALNAAQLDFKQYAIDDAFSWSELAIYASTLTILAVDSLPSPGGPDFEPISKNDVLKKIVLVVRSKWNAINDSRIKNAVALNQVLLMREGKASGYHLRAAQLVAGSGLPLSSLYEGVSGPFVASEQSDVAQHQCLWAYKSLERVKKLFMYEILSCAYREHPEKQAVRTFQVGNLLDRCESTCSPHRMLHRLSVECANYRKVYDQFTETARSIRPECMSKK